MTTPGSAEVQWRYIWLLLLVSLAIPISDYSIQIAVYPIVGHFASYGYYRVFLMVCIRAAIFAASTVHVHLRGRYLTSAPAAHTATEPAEHAEVPASLGVFVLRLVISAGASLASAFFGYLVVYDQVDIYLGFAFAPSMIAAGSTWDECINKYVSRLEHSARISTALSAQRSALSAQRSLTALHGVCDAGT
jgi:hypothetical protein